MRTRFITHVAGLFLFLTVFIGCIGFIGFGNDAGFDSNAWLNGDARTRGRMAEDLVARKLLVGLSAEEVERQLGHPKKNYGRAVEYHIDLGWPFKNRSITAFRCTLTPIAKSAWSRSSTDRKKSTADLTVPFFLLQ